MLITLIETNEYFAGRLFTDAWDSADPISQQKALNHSEDIINKLPFIGEKTEETLFPRLIDEEVVELPDNVKYACAEIAIKLLDGHDPEKEYEEALIKTHAFGNIRIERNDNYPEHVIAGVPSITAWRMLRPYLRSPTNIGIFRV